MTPHFNFLYPLAVSVVGSPEEGIFRPPYRHRTGGDILDQPVTAQAGCQPLRCDAFHRAERQAAFAHLEPHRVQRVLHRDGIDIAEQVFDQLQILELEGVALLGIPLEIAPADRMGFPGDDVGQYRNNPFGS